MEIFKSARGAGIPFSANVPLSSPNLTEKILNWKERGVYSIVLGSDVALFKGTLKNFINFSHTL